MKGGPGHVPLATNTNVRVCEEGPRSPDARPDGPPGRPTSPPATAPGSSAAWTPHATPGHGSSAAQTPRVPRVEPTSWWCQPSWCFSRVLRAGGLKPGAQSSALGTGCLELGSHGSVLRAGYSELSVRAGRHPTSTPAPRGEGPPRHRQGAGAQASTDTEVGGPLLSVTARAEAGGGRRPQHRLRGPPVRAGPRATSAPSRQPEPS